MSASYQNLKVCLCCGQTTLVEMLDLGIQPLANSYHNNTGELPAYPLGVRVCRACYHLQQLVAVDPDLMFKQYAYVSGTSYTLRKYFDDFARLVTADAHGGKGKNVLDIACNDGSQLASFMREGWSAFGVDPAENLVGRARATGATIVCDYWRPESARALGVMMDVLVAQNVFAHTSDPLGFLLTAKMVMHKGSRLFIQTSQADMLPRGEFDTIYHEHISFFSTRSMQALAWRAGFVLEDAFITPVHGGSYVFVLGFGEETANVAARIAAEEADGRYTMSLHTKFANNARTIVTSLKKTLEELGKDGYAVVGFGAAAKGNTLLNFGQISLEYIVDDNPLKHNLHTPGMNIPIYGPERLALEGRRVALVPLAWNFFDEIYGKVKLARPDRDDIFVTYFPAVTTRL